MKSVFFVCFFILVCHLPLLLTVQLQREQFFAYRAIISKFSIHTLMCDEISEHW